MAIVETSSLERRRGVRFRRQLQFHDGTHNSVEGGRMVEATA